MSFWKGGGGEEGGMSLRQFMLLFIYQLCPDSFVCMEKLLMKTDITMGGAKPRDGGMKHWPKTLSTQVAYPRDVTV